MTGVREADEDALDEAGLALTGTLVGALVLGGALVGAARAGATALLVAVAIVQAAFAAAFILGTAMPGRRGAFVLAALAAGGADAAASVWPDGRLGTLAPVLGLAIPAMFVHQLMRGAARVRIVSSVSAVAMLLLAEVAFTALLQLRHEFGTTGGGKVASAALGAVAGALVVGCLVDLVFPAPRFDPEVGRGLFALIASAGLGGSLGYLMLKGEHDFTNGRATFSGAALGALAGLLAIGTAFFMHTTSRPPTRVGRRLRPLVGALLPIALVSPPAFLLCLAIRS
jgi:hypothetical protein